MKNLSRQRLIVAITASCALPFVGCSHARVVNVQPGKGGEIAVTPAQSSDARMKAEALMRANCGNKDFEIVSEGEAVTGQTSNSYGNVDKGYRRGSLSTQQTTYTTNTTEWRLTYRCK